MHVLIKKQHQKRSQKQEVTQKLRHQLATTDCHSDALLRVAEAIQGVPRRADQSRSRAPNPDRDLQAIQDLARNAPEPDLPPRTSTFLDLFCFFWSCINEFAQFEKERQSREIRTIRKNGQSRKIRKIQKLTNMNYGMSAKKITLNLRATKQHLIFRINSLKKELQNEPYLIHSFNSRKKSSMGWEKGINKQDQGIHKQHFI